MRDLSRLVILGIPLGQRHCTTCFVLFCSIKSSNCTIWIPKWVSTSHSSLPRHIFSVKFSASSSKKPSSLCDTGPYPYGSIIGSPGVCWRSPIFIHLYWPIDVVYKWGVPSAHVTRRAISSNSGATPTVPSGHLNNLDNHQFGRGTLSKSGTFGTSYVCWPQAGGVFSPTPWLHLGPKPSTMIHLERLSPGCLPVCLRILGHPKFNYWLVVYLSLWKI